MSMVIQLEKGDRPHSGKLLTIENRLGDNRVKRRKSTNGRYSLRPREQHQPTGRHAQEEESAWWGHKML